MTEAADDPLKYKECLPEATADMFANSYGVAMERDEGEPPDELAGNGAIVSIISLVGDVEWTLSLGLPRETAEALAEKFAGFPISFDSADMADVVGEMLNVLAGDVKLRLDQHGVKTGLSLPVVLNGTDMRILTQNGIPFVTTHFTSDCGRLWVEVGASQDVLPTRRQATAT